MSKQKFLPALAFVLCSLLAPAFCWADLLLDGNLGSGSPSDSNYSSGPFANGAVGFSEQGWQLRLGYMHLDEFELETTDKPAEISVRAPYLEIVREIDANIINIEVGLGASYAMTKASFYNRTLSREEEFAPFAELALVKDVNELFSLKAGYVYMKDVSGSDISNYFLGFRFSFR
jgi:hypothetical protein